MSKLIEADMSSPILVAEGLSVIDRNNHVPILHEVDLRMEEGEFLCLTGPSGSGKSTLALALLQLLPSALTISSGSTHFKSVNLTASSDQDLAKIRGKEIAYIPQDPFSSLNPVLSCGVQAEEPLRQHTSFDRKQRREIVLEFFRKVGFSEPDRIYRSLPRELSGGQCQRVLLTAAAILNPRVIIADEPTTALDQSSASVILDILSKMKEETGTSILFITHDTSLVQKRSTGHLRMNQGRLVNMGGFVPSGESEAEKSKSATGAKVLVKVEALSKTFQREGWWGKREESVPVFQDVSFSLKSGEVLGIIGGSGQGKTTLGRCLAGLEQPDAGKILLDGCPMKRVGRTPHPVQVVYQNPYASLNPVLSIGETIEEGLRSMGVPAVQRRDTAVCLLERVGLPEAYYMRTPGELSGGERQRVVIARCLAVEPKVLVADEPTASLDEVSQKRVLSLLLNQAQKHDLGILLISHDMKVVRKICDRIVRLEDKQLVPEH